MKVVLSISVGLGSKRLRVVCDIYFPNRSGGLGYYKGVYPQTDDGFR